MGSVVSAIQAAFHHAIHELIVSVFDLLIYMALIFLCLAVGRLIGYAIGAIFRCSTRAVTSTSPSLQTAFKPLQRQYHKLP
uniref:E protein n=1 Tax=Kibale red colobus virus 1 TaxID=1885929 RepID=X2D5B6_9NIDO|nr:E protein [Kibale red colobus virus 1]